MECMQAKALRPSLCGELSHPELAQEIYYNTTTHTAVSCISSEDSLVDEFLNFQNVDFEEKLDHDHEYEEEEDYDEKYCLLDEDSSNLSSALSESQLTSELAVPDDDIAELEWVSHFVDDSVSEFSIFNPINKFRPMNRSEPAPNRTGPSVTHRFPVVPVKPRTKRSRPASRRSSPSQLSESSTTSSSASVNPVWLMNPVRVEPERKRPKKVAAVEGGTMFQRRCSHCQVQKTPQWRTGPLGAKTLCNACGVRFKSGRLFPEYRPACSPTFSSQVHSNSHRKVLEMRKRNEVLGPVSGLGFTQVIS